MLELVVVCHADDEILFSWPRFFADDRTYQVLLVSTDESNPERAWCKKRKYALADVCKLVGCGALRTLNWPSEFYKLPMRPDNKLRTFCEQVRGAIAEINPDVIWTHNPWGEYGMCDHRYLHNLIMESGLGKEIHTTDIRDEANWPTGEHAQMINAYFRSWEKTGEHVMTEEQKKLYDECEQIYHKYGCWTWSHPVIEHCSTYRFVR